ncbi:MAG: phosphatase PAP2-related protein, partial [Elusimicrobiota bacterium]
MKVSYQRYIFEFVMAVIVFSGSFVVNYYAGQYVRSVGASSPAIPSDLLLDFLPRMDLSLFFLWGFVAFIAFATVSALVWERDRIIYLLWMFALLISLRGLFIILTPMGQPKGAFPIESFLFEKMGQYMTFGNDLFFSSHTAMPFLSFLIYRNIWARVIFLLFSLTMALAVLLCRYHYSIDVASAFFITYALVRIHGNRMRPAY